MKPNEPGIWEWFDKDEVKRLVEVVDVASKFSKKSWLRVAFWGGYYNVNDEDKHCLTEWPDRWGKRVGDNRSLLTEQLYLQPTKEEMVVLLQTFDEETKD